MAVLGIDTSCYRTSLAIVSDGAICADQRRLLQVPLGGRGLRQSEALFQHVAHLGALCQAAFAEAGPVELRGVCVSARPRPVEGSYMPVFSAGEMAAQSVAAALGVPLMRTSHQQGHLRAALVDSGLALGQPFLAMHLSGGTTEVLRCAGDLGQVLLLGGTSDLHAGQLVDRVGVALGLEFPAGPMLETLAGPPPERPAVPTAVKGLQVSLSGAENQLLGMIRQGVPPEQVAAQTYSFLARTLAKLIQRAGEQTGLKRILIAGGVAASARLRGELAQRLDRLGASMDLYWARPALSGDNAVGVALMGEDLLRRGGEALS